MTKPLHVLLKALPEHHTCGPADAEICQITADSRQVTAGSLFVAIPGQAADGHRFVADAVRRGAVAVVGERAPTDVSGFPEGVPYVRVPEARLALAHLAAAWHDFPARRMRMIGVTGTDGKTTTTNLIYSILITAGIPAGMISTVNAHIGMKIYETGLHTTTPDATDVQRYLAEMAAEGAQAAVLETTSHGLAQRRVAACDFDVAVVTNVTHEHLDYHGTYERYRAAKGMLFEDLGSSYRKDGVPKVAILNRDDTSFEYLKTLPADTHLTYGLGAGADVTAAEIEGPDRGIRFTAHTPAGAFPVRSRLVGEFNVHNILAAIAAALSQGIAVGAIQMGVAVLQGLIGRMQRIDMGQPFTVIVDFAHTPNALRNALRAARGMTSARVIVVFGCAGLRDVAKRPLMGRIAAELADVTILTAEDPRTEALADINQQIIAGYLQSGRPLDGGLLEVPDRGEAIRRAIEIAGPGDLVLITGKGHERSLCFGDVETPWSDHDAVAAALRG